jgi:hypothetical protein
MIVKKSVSVKILGMMGGFGTLHIVVLVAKQGLLLKLGGDMIGLPKTGLIFPNVK